MNVTMTGESFLDEEASCCEPYLLGEKTPRSNDEMIRRYQENVQSFGFSGRTLLYPSDEFHETKLEKYLSLLEGSIQKGDSLLDIGCGYGSLAEQLVHNTSCTYQGIDVVPEFIEHAQDVYKRQANVTFSVMDMEQYVQQYKPRFDWCVLLGVLNSVPYPNHLVDFAWEICEKGLFFDINSIEKKDVTRYNTFKIPQYIELFKERGAKVAAFDVWDGCTILAVRKK